MRENESITLPDGRKLGIAEYGDPEGKPLIYAHGWPSSRYQAAYLEVQAGERGLRIIAPDRPGIGLSDLSPGRRFSDWPNDILSLAETLKLDQFMLLGVSGGCPYTLATAAALPDRVSKVAIVCGAPPLANRLKDAPMHWAYKTLIRAKFLRRPAMRGILPLSRWMIARGNNSPPMSWILKSIPERDRAALNSNDGFSMVTRSYLEGIRGGPKAMSDDGELYIQPWDFRPEDIKVPVKFWHGLADANLPCELAKELAARVPNAETCWVEGEGHYSLPVYHTSEVLDWLTAESRANNQSN